MTTELRKLKLAVKLMSELKPSEFEMIRFIAKENDLSIDDPLEFVTIYQIYNSKSN